MKKLLTAVLSVTMLGVFAATSFAAFGSVSKSTATASVSFAGAGLVNIAIQIRNRSDDAVVSNLSWNAASDIALGTTGWKASDQYILLTSTITASLGGVQIYSDNKSADMTHPYTGISTSTVAGLVGWSASNLALSSSTLPMCWRITDTSTTTLSIQRGTAGFPDRLWESTLGSAFPCFLWMMDKNTGGFANGMDYITVKARGHTPSGAAIQYGEGSFGDSASPDYIYVGADFTAAVTPAAYATVLRVEAYTE